MSLNKIIMYSVCCVLLACKSNTNPYTNDLHIEPSVLAKMDTANYTTLQWQDSVYDFGTINTGDSVHIKYHFTNVGNTPLFIFTTRTTCGCTVTDFPREPVLPGKSGFITATYKSGTQKGKIERTIFVSANTKGSRSNLLILRGMVQTSVGQIQ